MRKFLSIAILLIFPLLIKAQTTYVLDSTTLTYRLVKDSLDIPWEIIWGPDD